MENPAPIPAPDSEKESPPLLPPVLTGAVAFLWLWVLPIGVLLLLNLQGYWLIEGNMNDDQRGKALLLGIANALDLLAGVGLYVANRGATMKPAAGFGRLLAWALPAVLVQAGYLWLAVSLGADAVPQNVTAWIYPPQRYLFNQFAFAMLPLFLGILRIACARQGRGLGKSIAINLGLVAGGPLALFVLFHAVRLFDGRGDSAAIIAACGVVVLSIVMFVGIVRSIMLALRGAQRWGAGGERAAIVIFALVLPLCGLVLNRSIPFPNDFQAWEVYALVMANTPILLLASYQHARRPRFSFCLLCTTFPFSLYFFVVFLPYTPLSILAVIVMGAGFLVLTPTFLFVLHLHLLNKARRQPMPGSGRMHLSLGLLCFLLLPAFFTVRGLADKAALNAALDYVYTPTVGTGNIVYRSSLTNLRRALSSHRSYKNGIYYPMLSDFYAWLVFDNLILPDDKLARLETTFFGAAGSKENTDALHRTMNIWGGSSVRERSHAPRGVAPSHLVAVEKLDVSLAAAGAQNTVATFRLVLRSTGTAPAEYLQKLPLPPGFFVNGFRLYIDGKPVAGRVFEKKTALWVYTMIRDSERRDPGLLFYNTPEELELRVYPINEKAPATVEIDFLLPAPLSAESAQGLPADPAAALAQLGGLCSPQMVRDPSGTVVAGLDARRYPTVERESYLHLIVDRSADNSYHGDLAAALSTLRQRFPAARRARVTLANFEVIDVVPKLTPIGDLPPFSAAQLQEILPAAGGFSPDLPIAHAIRQHRATELDPVTPTSKPPPAPIFVILSRNAKPRPLVLDLTESWASLLPGLEIHELGAEGTFITHRAADLRTYPLFRLGNSYRPLVPGQVLRFLPAGSDDRLEFWSSATSSWLPMANIGTQREPTPWMHAVSLQLRQQDHDRNPGESNDLKTLVNASRESGILLAGSSYIVVENSAQWRTLDLSERQKLDQNSALAFRETPAPPALYVALGFAGWLVLRWLRRRRNRLISSPLFSAAAAP